MGKLVWDRRGGFCYRPGRFLRKGREVLFVELDRVVKLVEGRLMSDMIDDLNPDDFCIFWARKCLWDSDNLCKVDWEKGWANAIYHKFVSGGPTIVDVEVLKRLAREFGGAPNPREIRAIITRELIPEWEREHGHTFTCALLFFLMAAPPILPYVDLDPDKCVAVASDLSRDAVLTYLREVCKKPPESASGQKKRAKRGAVRGK